MKYIVKLDYCHKYEFENMYTAMTFAKLAASSAVEKGPVKIEFVPDREGEQA